MKSTFSRFFLTAALILLSALLAVGVSFQFFMRSFLTRNAMNELQTDGQVISRLATAYAKQDSLLSETFRINLTMSSQISGLDAVVCDLNGKVLLCSDSPFGCIHQNMVISDRQFVSQVLESGKLEDTGKIQGLYQDPRYMIALPFYDESDHPAGIILLSTSTAQSEKILNKSNRIFLWASLLTVAVAVVFMVFSIRSQAQPLRRIAMAANAFGHGNLKARVPIEDSASQEVQDLAIAFNNMAASLEKSESQRQEFVANISHELKTPMTTIGGYVDGILDGTIPADRQEHYLQLVSKETKRLNRLVRSMLDISRLEGSEGIPDEQKSHFDVCECARQVLIGFEKPILDKDLQVQVDMPDHPVYTWACQDSITQVIYNLTDNGIKFCKDGGQLSLQVQQSATKIYISIANEGQTIPAEELPLLFDRFHKTDKSRSENRDGWGLGLYITKTLVLSHGEDISVSSQDNLTTFTFTLPLVQ